jgi:hypothetical protein
LAGSGEKLHATRAIAEEVHVKREKFIFDVMFELMGMVSGCTRTFMHFKVEMLHRNNASQ